MTTSRNKRLLQMLVIVSVMCFLVVSFSSERTLRRTSKLVLSGVNTLIDYLPQLRVGIHGQKGTQFIR